MRDTEQKVQEAIGNLVARMEHDWECASIVFSLEGSPCDCNPRQWTDALIAAVREDEREQAVARVEGKAFAVSLHGITNDQVRIVTLDSLREAIRYA